MWLEDLMAPNGPQSPAVYWFRRGMALLLVIIVLWIVWPSGGGGTKKAAGTGTGTTSTPPPTTPQSTPTGAASTPSVATCAAEDVSLSADADQSEYTAGQTPKVTISIRNITSGTGAHSCVLQTAERYLTISSGTDLWYSSKACQTAPSQPVTIAPNQTVTSTYTWNRKRQATDCSVGGNAADGTYLAKAHLAARETQGAVIRLR